MHEVVGTEVTCLHYLAKMRRIAQHVHVQQLGQIVKAPFGVRLTKLGTDGGTLSLDNRPLLRLSPGASDCPDHFL